MSISADPLTQPSDSPKLAEGFDPSYWTYACEIDTERDIVAPFRIRATNTNSDFGQEVDIITEVRLGLEDSREASVNASGFDGPFAKVAVEYGDGPECEYLDGEGSSWGWGSAEQLAPGDSVETEGYFIVPGARSPAFPKGDPAVVRRAKLVPTILAESASATATEEGPWGDSELFGPFLPLAELLS